MDRCEETDGELLGRMLQGDEDSFTALYRRRQAAVYRFAFQMTGCEAAAEDVTQEVFLVLIRSGSRFDPSRGTLTSFLFGIARNCVLRRLEKDQTGEVRETSGDAVDDIAAAGDLLDDLTRRETIDQVRRAVLSLPLVYREAVVLCDLQDTSYEEASVALDCPVGTVRSRLSRGRAMLARKLSEAPRPAESMRCARSL